MDFELSSSRRFRFEFNLDFILSLPRKFFKRLSILKAIISSYFLFLLSCILMTSF